MKKLAKLILFFLIITTPVCADDITDVRIFFDSYVKAANSYDKKLVNFYSPCAKIIRYVVKDDGSVHEKKVVLSFYEYKKQLNLLGSVARLKNYKNNYSQIKITRENDKYKVTAQRQPTTEKYNLPAYFIVQKDLCGDYKIIEEAMHTKDKRLLKHVEN